MENRKVTKSVKMEARLRRSSWQYTEWSSGASDSGRLASMLQRDLPPITVSPSMPRKGSGGAAHGGTHNYHNHLTVLDIPHQWSYSSQDPHDNLALIYSSEARSDMGSYFINRLSVEMRENIEGKLEKRLSDICEEIQEKLLIIGRPNADFEFGGETRNIMMRVNDHTDVSTISSDMVRACYDKEDTFEVYQ